jgi:hypothetical protein
MSLPPDSVGFTDVAPGAGVVEHAGKIISSKFFSAYIGADPDGHMIDSRPEYFVYFTAVTNAANREVAELFNASATVIVRVRGIWILPTATGVTGAQQQYDINKISAVGTTGSTVMTIRRLDSNMAAIDANVTARFGSTAGATLDHLFFPHYHWNEETSVGTGLPALINQLPTGVGTRVVELVLRQNQGVQVKQIVGAVGLTGALMYLVTD